MRRKQSLISRFPLLHIAVNALIIGLFVWGVAMGIAATLGD